MPGFQRNRFFNLSKAEEEELNCGLCHHILCPTNPLVTPCCGRTYCYDCIHNWINTYQNCPFDRRSLKVEELEKTQSIVTNIINRLSIKCDFHENGCRTISQLGVLSSHTQNCYYNPQRKCDFCDDSLFTSNSHNCIQNLKTTNRCLKVNIKTLESLNEKLREENEKLVSSVKISQNNCMVRAIDSARNLLNHSIITNLIPNHCIRESELIKIAQNAIIQCNCFNDIAIQMRKVLNNNDDYNYNITVYSNKCCAINNSINNDCIQLFFGDLTIQLIKYKAI